MSGAGLSARDVRPGCVATRSGAACAEQHILCSRTSGVCNGETACSLACCEDKENSTEILNTKQQLRPPPCSRHRCRARRLHLKQQTRRCESALVRLIMHSWRTHVCQKPRCSAGKARALPCHQRRNARTHAIAGMAGERAAGVAAGASEELRRRRCGGPLGGGAGMVNVVRGGFRGGNGAHGTRESAVPAI